MHGRKDFIVMESRTFKVAMNGERTETETEQHARRWVKERVRRASFGGWRLQNPAEMHMSVYDKDLALIGEIRMEET